MATTPNKPRIYSNIVEDYKRVSSNPGTRIDPVTRHFDARTALLIPISVAILVFPAWADTAVGDKLEMQCGDHKVVLTCGHSVEIATRQRSYPRLCNDNTLSFIAKNGTTKTFGTYPKGEHRDKTPIQAACEIYSPTNVYQVRVGTDDTAAPFFIELKENGDSIPPGLRLRYRIDYTESKTISRIAIQEKASWRKTP